MRLNERVKRLKEGEPQLVSVFPSWMWVVDELFMFAGTHRGRDPDLSGIQRRRGGQGTEQDCAGAGGSICKRGKTQGSQDKKKLFCGKMF